jgi:excisionase family DNA binding protein
VEELTSVAARAACSDPPRSYAPGRSRHASWTQAGRERSVTAGEASGDDAGYRLLLTIPQVCNALAVSRDAVYELLRSGRLPSVTLGRSRRIRIADLERFVAGLPRTAA